MEHHLEQRSGTRTATSMNWERRSGSLMATATANCLAQRWGSLKARWKACLTAYSTAQHWETAFSMAQNWERRSGSLMATATAKCLAQRWGSLKARWKAHLTAYSTAQHWEQSWVLRMAISMVRRWDWRSGRPTATSMAQR